MPGRSSDSRRAREAGWVLTRWRAATNGYAPGPGALKGHVLPKGPDTLRPRQAPSSLRSGAMRSTLLDCGRLSASAAASAWDAGAIAPRRRHAAPAGRYRDDTDANGATRQAAQVDRRAQAGTADDAGAAAVDLDPRVAQPSAPAQADREAPPAHAWAFGADPDG